MVEVIFSVNDLDEIEDYISEDSPQNAQNFIHQLIHQAESIALINLLKIQL